MQPDPIYRKHQATQDDDRSEKRMKLATDSVEGDLTSATVTSLPTNTHLRSEEEICFGMLHQVVAQLKWYPDISDQDLIPVVLPDGQSFIRMVLDIQQDVGFLQITNGRAIGVLSNHTSRGISSLKELEGVVFQPWVNSLEWNDKVKSFHGNGSKNMKAVYLKIDLVLCGARRDSESIAQKLSMSELYLQNPHIGTFECEYDNPQLLHIPGLGCFDNVELLHWNTMGDEHFDLDSFFDELPVHDYLTQHEVDQRVVTSLLSHQRAGVDFIVLREKEECHPNHSLWQLNVSDHGETYYQHMITGAKSRVAVDCAGGILADDMGLGKTLTTLSAIVNSMDSASLFAFNNGKEVAKSTIIIVPSELLLNTWTQEISKHIFHGAIRFIRYHGLDRREYDSSLPEYDIILTTYGTAMVEFRRRTSPLYCIKWYRLVLDEAHTIRNSSSKQFQAVNSISSNIRWCLTGTPIQNSLDDLGSLVRFLKVPFLDDSATFRKHISKVQLRKCSREDEFENLRLLLGSICLRRNKSILPNLGFASEECRPDFTSHEREQYETLEFSFKKAIKFAAKRTTNNFAHHRIMEALLRLRMFCNNGLEGPSNISELSSTSQPDEILSIFQQSDEAICSYCSCDVLSINRLVDSEEGYVTRCLRLVCNECVAQYRIEHQKSGSETCPLCQSQHGIDGPSRDDLSTSNYGKRQYPSKIRALIRDVKAHYLQDKCVVFSFWKRTLDVVGSALDEEKIKYVRIDGNVTSRKRNDILNEFQSRHASRVLLMTFSTGAVGLNGLTVANRIHILEPQWNPAVENQAVGRVLRIDQVSNVTVIRYVMYKSIEEVVQSRQLRKTQLAGGGFMVESEQNQKN